MKNDAGEHAIRLFFSVSIYNSVYEYSKVHGTVMLRWERAEF